MKKEQANGTISGNAENKINSNSSEMLEQKTIEGTPFTAVRFGNNWFLAMGKYRLTAEGECNSYEECEHESENASWWRIMQIINIMIQENKTEQLISKAIQNLDGLDENEMAMRLQNLADERKAQRTKLETNN